MRFLFARLSIFFIEIAICSLSVSLFFAHRSIVRFSFIFFSLSTLLYSIAIDLFLRQLFQVLISLSDFHKLMAISSNLLFRLFSFLVYLHIRMTLLRQHHVLTFDFFLSGWWCQLQQFERVAYFAESQSWYSDQSNHY